MRKIHGRSAPLLWLVMHTAGVHFFVVVSMHDRSGGHRFPCCLRDFVAINFGRARQWRASAINFLRAIDVVLDERGCVVLKSFGSEMLPPSCRPGETKTAGVVLYISNPFKSSLRVRGHAVPWRRHS